MKKSKTKLTVLLVIGFMYMSCSTNDNINSMDTVEPTVSIQSPDVNQTYVGHWGGAWPEGDLVNLKAKGVDETTILSMQLTVENNLGVVVFEKTVSSTTPNETELVISENFQPTDAGTYSVVVVVTDENGNTKTSTPRTFSVQ